MFRVTEHVAKGCICPDKETVGATLTMPRGLSLNSRSNCSPLSLTVFYFYVW